MQAIPIRFEEKVKLPSLGLPADIYKQANLTMESDRYICIKEASPDGSVFFDMIEMQPTPRVQKKPIKADAAMMHPTKTLLCLRIGQSVQVLDLAKKSVAKEVEFKEAIVYWHWVTDNILGVVCTDSVFHVDLNDSSSTANLIFTRTDDLKACQILSYSADSSGKWFALYGINTPDSGVTINGCIQLYSIEKKQHQNIEGFAPCFGDVSLADPTYKNSILACVMKKPTEAVSSVYIIELGEPKGDTPKFKKKQALSYPAEVTSDFPVLSHISSKYGVLYIITKMGYLFLYEVNSAAYLYRTRITNDLIFAACRHNASDGMLCVNRKGSVLLINIDEATILDYIRNYCKHIPDYMAIAYKMSTRTNLAGSEQLFIDQFNAHLTNGDYVNAAKTAISAPNNILRTAETIQTLRSIPSAPGQPKPILQYFSTLLESVKLNAIESIEIVKPVLQQGRKDIVENWLKAGKLECTPELGDMIRTVDPQLSLGVFRQTSSHDRVIQSLVETNQFDQVLPYCRKNGISPDFLAILGQILDSGNKAAAIEFAKMMCTRKPGEAPMVDPSLVFDAFITRKCFTEVIGVMVEALSGNRPEEANLQTKLFEITLTNSPKIAEGIFQMNTFTYYDKIKIARLCESVGLLHIALKNYTDIADIRRVIVNVDKLKKEFVLDYLNDLEPTNALICMFDILKANPQNLQTVVEAAVKFNGKIPTSELIKLFDAGGDVRGQYFFLGQILSTSEDPEAHYKYIEAAVHLGQLGEVERVIRQTKHYDPMRVKELLMSLRLPDPKALIYLCDIHGYIEELTQYIAKYKIWKFLEIYLYKVNPDSTPKVMAALLDLDTDENIYKPILYNVRMCPIGPLVSEFEKRNKLKVLLNWLEARYNEGNVTPELHTALAKIYVDTGREAQTFLINDQYYDQKDVGKYCETRNPHFAFYAYKKAWGKCDNELIELCYKNLFFNLLAQYLVERQSPELWKIVLTAENVHRPKIVEQVVQSALPQTHNPEDVAVTVKAFIEANLPDGLIELLDQLVLHHPEFMEKGNLQTLLILTAIKSDHTRVMDYVKRLDKYDAKKLSDKAIEAGLFEEALAMFEKFEMHEEAMEIMITKIGDLARAEIYAGKIGQPIVWSRLGMAQLHANKVPEAIASYLKAEDASQFVMVIEGAERAEKFEELVEYLLMARQKMKEPQIDGELIYSYAKCQRYTELEDFINQTNSADLQVVGDRCYDDKLYEAGKIIFTHIGNNARLASCLVHLKQFQAAIDAAKKANTPRTWKEVNYACVRARQFRLAAIAGLNIIIHPDHLGDVIEHYEKYGYWEELIKLLDSGLTLEEAHTGMFTELGVLLAKYVPERLMDHLKSNFQRIHVPKLLRACEEYKMWPEAVFLNSHYDQHDRAVQIMMDHSPSAWKHEIFVENLEKAANSDLHYRAIYFYLREQPMLLNEMLIAISNKLDLPKSVMVLKKTNYIALTLPFLKHAQTHNIVAVNEAINDIFLENDDHQGLRASVLEYDNFDQLKLAKLIEKHDLLEFRRIAAIIYRKNKKYVESLNLSKADELHKDAIETALDSKKPELAEHLLRYFISIKERECFASCLYTCYELLKPDVVLELTWRFGLFEFAMPFMVQTMRDLYNRVEVINKKTEDIQKKEEKNAQQDQLSAMPMEYADLMPGFSQYPALMAPPEMMMPGFNAYPQLMPAPGMMGMGMGMGMNMGMGMGMGMGMDMGMMGMGQSTMPGMQPPPSGSPSGTKK